MRRITGNRFWLVVSLAMLLLSGVVASLVQTSAGRVAVKEMRWETRSGEMISALLYKPASATSESPAPAIVVGHGWWNNRDILSPICLELARRGYVVVSFDMYGHGDSDSLQIARTTVGGTGMYDAVRLIADLPYVDKARIGVTGHSHGARAANYSVAIDNQEAKPLIAAVLLVDCEPVYLNADGKFANVYGFRHVGLVADRYDEFDFRSYGPGGAVLTQPRQYIGTPKAQSFLHFGSDPSRITDRRVAGQFYTEHGAMRVTYTPTETHPWGVISSATVACQIAFFDKALGAPNPIAADSQIWQWKELFTTIGLIGFGIFLVTFARALLPHFSVAPVHGGEGTAPHVERLPMTKESKGATWFWSALTVLAVLSAVSYVLMSNTYWIRSITFSLVHTIFTQGAVFFLAFWLAFNGLATLLVLTICYQLFGRKNRLNLRETGILPGWRKFFDAIALGAVVVATAFGIVFVLNYFFKIDLRLWLIGVNTFSPDKLWIALRYLPLLAVYFFANSIAINCFNPCTRNGRQWVGTTALVIFNTLGPASLVIAQYAKFYFTGDTIRGLDCIFVVWLFPVLIYLAASVIISRKLYRSTGNPYVGGFINAAVVTLIAVTNTLTVVR